jgi:hypothetical protein
MNLPISILGPHLGAAAALLGVFGLASTARADKTTVYPGGLCRVALASEENNVQRSSGDTGNISVKSTSTNERVRVVCPVTKFTSGPSITNDQLYFGFVSHNSPVAGDVRCALHAYRSSYSGSQLGGPSNIVDSNPDAGWRSSLMGSGNINFSSGLTPTSWWTTSSIWTYGALVCEVKRGARIDSYSMSERGTTQSNYRIFSPAACTPTTDAEYEFYVGELNVFPGGFWDGNYGTFAVNCPIPSDAARGVQASVTPSTNSVAPLRYSMDGSTWINVAQNTGNSEWPSKVVRHTYGTGSQTLRFDQAGPEDQGDPRILGYRTMPMSAMSRSGWGTSASHNFSGAFNALDGNAGTRWTTGTAQSNNPVDGQWYQLDLIGSQQFMRIVLDSTNSPGDYPAQYRVHLSNDGANWGTAVATGSGSGNVVTIDFLPTFARYVRVYQVGSKSNWWSIHELNIWSVGQ